MRTTFEGIGRGYRTMSTQMLKAIAGALPNLGVHSFIIKEKQATLYAYTKANDGKSWDYSFTAHPAGQYVELRIRELSGNSAESNVRPVARISYRNTTDLPKTIEKALLKLGKL